MQAAFVTATGTGIGKTFVATALIGHLRGRGVPVRALKPVVSGFEPDGAAESDSGLLLKALGEDVTSECVAAISPWRFAAPLSPDMAAARESRSIDFDAVAAYCETEIARAARDGATLIVEGVGGVMVPLDARRTVLDWMAALNLPVLVVAGSYLGTISHTLTALQALRARNVAVAGIVVSESEGAGLPPLAGTVASIARHAGGTAVLSLGRATRPDAREVAAIARLFA